MRILLVNYTETLEPGGINKVVREIAYHASMRGHQVVVFNPARTKAEECNVTVINSNCKIIRGYKGYIFGLNPRNISLLVKIIRQFSPHIIHVHEYHSLFPTVTIIALKEIYKVKTPIIFSPHLDIERSSLAGRYLWKLYNSTIGKKVFDLSDYIIVHSKYGYKVVEYTFNVKEEKLFIIPHGVDTIETNREKFVKNNDEITLLYVGALIRRKGVDYIIETLHKLVHDFGIQRIKLKIVGTGPEKAKLMRLAKKLNVYDKIEWIANLPYPKLIGTIKNSHILLLLSRSEAYGIIVTEALALGVPVIVTKRTALREFLVEPGCYGVDYPPEPEKVASTIINVINNYNDKIVKPTKIKRWSGVIDSYLKVYVKVFKEFFKQVALNNEYANQ